MNLFFSLSPSKVVYVFSIFYSLAQDLKDFEETILQGVGYDKDGKISRKELTMILLTLAKIPTSEQPPQ